MDGLKEQILRVVRLEDVVARYLPLGRSGGHTLVGLCPFHADRHPSLRVRTDKQYYKCFACGEGGDVFRFVQQVEGVSFREALLRIAGWYGLYASDGVFSLPPVRCRQVPPEGAVLVASRAAILSLLRQHQFILGCLTPYVPTEPVLAAAYLAFEVGLAPSSLPASYVSLCGRLVFPIRNEAGTLVAFAGRYVGVADGKTAKYVNSPTSPVYHKDRLLYGLSLAEASIRRHGFVYVTEGYKDVLAMHAVGFEQTVALCGTALTAHHAELLRRNTHQL
ncbi:MAG: CHC2 zinc finger domain-containing protein [Tannerellaceae bacterium]